MTKIRENMTKAFAIFAGVFVVYIVLDWGMDLSGRKRAMRGAELQEVGSVNGHHILLKDFSELVRQASDNQKQQTGTEPDENQLKIIRDQVWTQLVEENLFTDEMKRLGVSVTDQEIVDWVRGDNPPSFLRQQFTDSTGTFNRSAYESAIQNPQNAPIWIKVEDFLRKQRLREKLQSIISSGVHVTDNEILQRFMDQNIKYDADAILFDPNVMVKDSEITVTDADLKKEYDDNADEFKQEATRKLKYVKFDVQPSKADTDAVMNDLADIQKRVKEQGADFVDLAKTYTETPINDTTFFKHGELSPEREKQLFGASEGDIIGPVNEADGYHLIKVLKFATGADDFLRASHILIQVENNDSAKALKLAKEVFAKAKSGQDFSFLAQQYSKDGSAQQGGDVGWFGKGKMVKPFEEAAYKTKVGQVVGPVKTQFGYHIIKVTARDNRTVRFADVHLQIHVSSATTENISQNAQDFAFNVKDQGDFAKVAAQSNYKVVETPAFEKDAFIPGIGSQPGVNKFAFNGKAGDVSDVLSLPNGGFAVFTISELRNAGLRPFEELRTTLDARVKREKKMEKLKALAMQVRQQLSPTDSLSKVSTINPALTAQNLRGITLNGFLPNIGRDLKFSGALSNMTVGELSQPVDGQRGWYIVKLLAKSSFDSTAFNAQKSGLRSQILSERRNSVFTDWSANLKKSADIVDNRDQYYK